MAAKSLSPEQLQEYLKCAVDPEHFISTYLTVEDKLLEIQVPFKLMPHQRTVVRGYRKHKRNLVQKYRQGGITSISAAYMAWLLTFNDGYKIAVVADKLKLAEKIVRTISLLMESCPAWMRATPVVDNNNEKFYSNTCELQAFAATPDGLRGFSPNLLFVDEAAYLATGDAFMTSAKGTMSVNGDMILNSTPNGQDDLYYVTYESAIAKRNKWNVIEIFWYEDPRFSKGLCWVKGEESIRLAAEGVPLLVTPEIQARNAELRAAGYLPRNAWYYDMCAEYEGNLKKIRSEIEGEFVGSGGTMVDETLLMQQTKDYVSGPLYTNKDKDGHCWTFAEPEPGASYVLGFDVSYGGSDFHGLQIIKEGPVNIEQVVEYQCQIPPEAAALIINALGRKYNNAYVAVDVTGGAGAVVMRELALLGYPNLHFSEVSAKVTKDILGKFEKKGADGKALIPGFLINGVNRPIMLELVKRFIENGLLIIRSARLIGELKGFVWNPAKNRWDHRRAGHDDLLFALAMALFVREYKIGIMQLLDRDAWLALAGARTPRTAGDAPPQEYDEQGQPVAKIRTRDQLFNQYQEDGPVGGRVQGSDRPKFVLPFVQQ